MNPDPNRRRVLLAAAAWLLASGARAATRLEPTPAQSAGPFYPTEPPLDDDQDLTRVRGALGVAQGRITDLSGRLLDRDGRPISATRIEIWQCDATGRYHHPLDRGGARDPNFQGFGHTVTDAEGRYRFRTIRPVPYPGRTPHIHIAVFPPGEPLYPRAAGRGRTGSELRSDPGGDAARLRWPRRCGRTPLPAFWCIACPAGSGQRCGTR